MIYRVILKISYYENWFDFRDFRDAESFARMALMCFQPNEDRKDSPLFVTIRVMKIEECKEEDTECEKD